MSLCADQRLLRLARKWPEGAAVAALKDTDAVSHKKAPVSEKANESASP